MYTEHTQDPGCGPQQQNKTGKHEHSEIFGPE